MLETLFIIDFRFHQRLIGVKIELLPMEEAPRDVRITRELMFKEHSQHNSIHVYSGIYPTELNGTSRSSFKVIHFDDYHCFFGMTYLCLFSQLWTEPWFLNIWCLLLKSEIFPSHEHAKRFILQYTCENSLAYTTCKTKPHSWQHCWVQKSRTRLSGFKVSF